jgi:hypothetical protein
MFQNDELKNYLETSSTVRTQSAVIAEWNMNIPENISLIGNYRYRPSEGASSKFGLPITSFDINDEGEFYKGATDADVVIDGGLDDSDEPRVFPSKKQKDKMLYSLEDCFGKFRPRSGINKLRYFPNSFSHHTNINMIRRPRYYMAHKDDQFKYWSSYRTEADANNRVFERGIANKLLNGQHYIDDASPFVVYKDIVPTNRIVVKMQTNVGEIDLGPFAKNSGSFPDPFYGNANKTTPVKWKVQVLKGSSWVDAISFNSASSRRDGSQIIGSDGYVELSYGLIIPEKYRDTFIKAEEYFTASFLPERSVNGYAYLIKQTDSDVGIFHIWSDVANSYETFVPEYGWYLEEGSVDRLTNFVTDLTSPVSYVSPSTGNTQYREFDEILGIRIVVDTMNKVDSIFDLIELSPRLAVNLSEKVESFNLTKAASDLGNSGMPVGQLLAGVGSVTLFDYDLSFSSINSNSIVSKYLSKNIQFKFYEVVIDIDGFDYFVPMKTMYSEGMPDLSSNDRTVSLELRDLFFYFESQSAPQILIQNASLSYAISLLLDSVGFSNYVFKRAPEETEAIIPFFFVAPDTSIAEVLNDIAVSTQTAAFFDEYNNLVFMSKEYMLPEEGVRETDITLYGSNDFATDGQISNKTTSSKLANIVDVSSQQDEVFNDGKISYTTRYIQRSYGSIRQASMIDKDKTWIYKPALLWEVAGTENTKSVNDVIGNQSAYVLGAIPLQTTLSSTVPSVKNGVVVDNIMDFGEGVYWITRYNGYFYANGEIVKYDAVEYEIPGVNVDVLTQTANGQIQAVSSNTGGSGKVWITSIRDYQKYFAKIPFNGKMYPTGRVRIFSEPNYVEINQTVRLAEGAVAKHGRGQFGTTPVNHFAGLSSYWSSNDNVRGCSMNSSELFGGAEIPSVTLGPAGRNDSFARNSSRTGVIKNFLTYNPETEKASQASISPGTIQSSAFVFTGPSFTTTEKPIDFVSYVYKPLTDKFKHFGTRVRIVGKVENSDSRGQSPIGSSTYYIGNATSPSQNVVINGSSAGIAVMLNPETNNGYYFEIAALSENNIQSYEDSDNIQNLLFYKVMKSTDTSRSQAVPVKLWGGLAQITVDDGKFTGQYRMTTENNPTVYDIAVEYQDIPTGRRFYLYVNNKLIATVVDPEPLPIYNNVALFIRGSSRAMFENVYAIANNYSQNTVYALDTPVNSAFSEDEIDVNESFRKYSMSGVIQASYLSGISPSEPPKYNMYFEEFGTIMREAAYFNVRYDKAYPALSAQLSPTFNGIKGYTTSGFIASAYGAEFLIFNATDTALSLDETSGNYLRIQGVTFTQESQHDLTVDEYFSKKSDYSNPSFAGGQLVSYPTRAKQDYQDIKVSRLTHGKKEFTLEAPYIQSHDDADNLMGWMISKIMKPRRSVGINVFAMPILQLGDIVEVSYKDNDNVNQISKDGTRFVVYQIDYSKTSSGPEMQIFLSEVV